ncbi:chitin disaccharide deacetylase [Butyricicoccus pullicaecorum]|uniref:Carbohydrate deacetylase n=1 Tax=Butyricicoccus pullicaecorum 1.2 TaxID=1203606 RepID=R8W4W9_9FIRM|nr:chitin disaccharide deacetylase [Butyricicoccus pullicaecorum]EOQ38207.1 hypothetical protein HMPREF1526_01235 [Butyricicoccus pullicaecorum 1.2]SKA54599.1 hypothetical protein SAMN02745978_00617 [Butyricicoccus pullicaecorum DSM 23266]
MKHLILNADDFGYSYGVNYGIIESHLRGVLTSTTLMAGMPGFDHAVSLAKAHPSLGVGVHLTLTCGRPVLTDHKTLTEPNGDFHSQAYYHNEEQPLDKDEVYREWKAQIEKVLAAGIEPTHLDSHHHVHTFRGLEDVFVRLAREYDLPVRNSRRDCTDNHVQGVPCPNYLVDFIEGSGAHFHTPLTEYAPAIESNMHRILLKAFKTLDCVEIMCHPAYLDTAVMLHSSFNLHRMCEVDLLISPATKAFIEQLEDVSLANYKTFYQEVRK